MGCSCIERIVAFLAGRTTVLHTFSGRKPTLHIKNNACDGRLNLCATGFDTVASLGDSCRPHEGIHISEIADLNLPEVTGSIYPYLIVSIAILDSRIRSNAGQYIYLSEWDDARRLSPLEAVKACLNDSVSPLAIGQIHSIVESLIKRPCNASTVSACLQAIDADFDKASNTWSVPSVVDDPPHTEQATSG
jgi:hypothetical protein